MFSIGEYVLNQNTKRFGKVVGYGHQIQNGMYLPTLKVLIEEVTNPSRKGFVEDIYSVWQVYT